MLNSRIASTCIHMLCIREYIAQNTANPLAGGVIVREHVYLLMANLLAQLLDLLSSWRAEGAKYRNSFIQHTANSFFVILSFNDDCDIHGIHQPYLYSGCHCESRWFL